MSDRLLFIIVGGVRDTFVLVLVGGVRDRLPGWLILAYADDPDDPRLLRKGRLLADRPLASEKKQKKFSQL